MKKICPLTGDECMQHGCEFYTHLIGKDPQTGKDIDNFGCAIAFLPMLLVENAQQSRQTGAAVESFRNNMTKQNDKMLQLTEDGINESIKAIS
jgi:hypothetical protein